MQKTAKSLLFSYYLCTFAYSNEPLKQAGGSASSDLIIRRLQQDTDIRWFPVRNLENRVISQTSDKQDGLRILPKLRKKGVTKDGFEKINAILPKIKIKGGRTGKSKNRGTQKGRLLKQGEERTLRMGFSYPRKVKKQIFFLLFLCKFAANYKLMQ